MKRRFCASLPIRTDIVEGNRKCRGRDWSARLRDWVTGSGQQDAIMQCSRGMWPRHYDRRGINTDACHVSRLSNDAMYCKFCTRARSVQRRRKTDWLHLQIVNSPPINERHIRGQTRGHLSLIGYRWEQRGRLYSAELWMFEIPRDLLCTNSYRLYTRERDIAQSYSKREAPSKICANLTPKRFPNKLRGRNQNATRLLSRSCQIRCISRGRGVSDSTARHSIYLLFQRGTSSSFHRRSYPRQSPPSPAASSFLFPGYG